jgi:hypothetical protein
MNLINPNLIAEEHDDPLIRIENGLRLSHTKLISKEKMINFIYFVCSTN